MVLFCERISRKEIAEYYNVAYDTVKKSLQLVASKYKCYIAEECISLFKSDYEKTDKYQNIIAYYKLQKQGLV